MGGVAVGGGPPGAIGCAICAGGAPPHIPNGGPGIPYPGSTGGVGNTIGCAGCGGGNGTPYPGSTCTDPMPVIVTCLLIPLESVIVPTIVIGCAISLSTMYQGPVFFLLCPNLPNPHAKTDVGIRDNIKVKISFLLFIFYGAAMTLSVPPATTPKYSAV